VNLTDTIEQTEIIAAGFRYVDETLKAMDRPGVAELSKDERDTIEAGIKAGIYAYRAHIKAAYREHLQETRHG
jgi:hypothetical protein